MENEFRMMLVYFFCFLSVAFVILAFLAPVKQAKDNVTPFKAIIDSTLFFLLTIICVCGALISYDTKYVMGSIISIIIALPVLGIRLLIGYFTSKHY
jgi:hypothetical protein